MNAVWITPEKNLNRTAMYRFDRTVKATKQSEIKLSISADTRYKFTVNGHYICEGPCQSDHWTWKYETVTVPKMYLKEGENLFSFRVFHERDNQFITQAHKDTPTLWVSGTVDGEPFGTTPDWMCAIEHKMMFVRPGNDINNTMIQVERISAESDELVKCVCFSECNVEALNRNPYGAVLERFAMSPRAIPILKPGKVTGFTEVRRSDGVSELDAGIYTTAYPKFVFKGKAGGVVRFTYAECYCGGDNKRTDKGRRDLPEGNIVGYCDEIELTGKKQEYTPFYFRPFRFVKVEYPDGCEFIPEKQTYQPYFYPIEEKGYVKSDAVRNNMWDISLNTLRCCSHETFVDCPYYEQAQYDMDTYLEMMFTFRVTNDYALCRKAVYDLALSQEPDGMLCAHYPSTQRQIIPTFSLFWIHMLRDYVTYSGDLTAAKELVSVMDRVLNAFELLRTKEGLVGVTKYWHYTDWVPGWQRGVPPHGAENPLTLSSMMYSVALAKAATIAKEIGRNELAKEYLKRRDSVNLAVNTHCYDAEKQFYVDVPGYGGYSEHTAVWAVLSGAVSGDEATALMERSFTMDVKRASFSFKFFNFRAIEQTGLYNKYADSLFAGWYKMMDWGCTTWCENPDNPRSECHAWSSAPMYEFSAVALGVKPTATGFKKAVIRPDFSFGDEVCGSVPTPKGEIKVAWKKTGDKTELKIKLPKGIKATVVLPEREDETVIGTKEYTL